MDTFDVVVVGGGPAGSSCATVLGKAGLRVAVLDRARFPRVKLCAGWLSAPIWDVLGTSASEYPHSLWSWNRCHVYYAGKRHTSKASGYFIRRYEFDDWLLSGSGAQVLEHSVKHLERDADGWIIDGKFRAHYLVGAGGTHCPVARSLFPPKVRRPVGAQELEFEASSDAIAATRIGEDGEPELLLHRDLSGYAWNVPKSDWLNVGCGTVDPKQVKPAWSEAKSFFQEHEHVPQSAKEELAHVKGHSYYLFDPNNLETCEHENAFLVGDALGLSHPLTAEGILPSIVSGQLCAQAILMDNPASYQGLLKNHPVLSDYSFLYRMREKASVWRSKPHSKSRLPHLPTPTVVQTLAQSALAAGFAWMFSGQPIPGRPLRRLLRRS